jgi:purple acid phosphatase-like protein/calcineurin-like phosphoesterase family protein
MQLSLPAVILCALASVAGHVQAQVINIHTTFGSDPRTQITVSWRSPFNAKFLAAKPPANSPHAVAEYGMDVKYGSTATAKSFESGGGLQHHAVLADLKPGTTYHYRVKSGEHTGPDCTFRTAPAADSEKPFTFAVLGDVEGGAEPTRAFGELAKRLAGQDIAFFAVLGDLVYFGQQQSNWDAFFLTGAPLFQSCVFVPVLGDHAMERRVPIEGEKVIVREAPMLYLDQFLLPDNHTKPSYSYGKRSLRGLWYSFDYGAAHITSFEYTGELTPPFRKAADTLQPKWIADDLAKTKAPWRIMLSHRAFYPGEPTKWDAILADGKVDLGFGAHAGGWTVSHPILNGKVAAEGKRGTVHVKLPKVGSHMTTTKERDVKHWSTALPKTVGERVPGLAALVTVHPTRTDVVAWLWTKKQPFHTFSLTPRTP